MPGPHTLLDLTSDEDKIVKFVNGVEATGGGDSPECYELVLHEARTKLNWKAGDVKVVVLIGDDVPHDKNYPGNKKKIDWRNELDLLLESKIQVYGVQALRRGHATSFYQEIANKTNGIHLNLDQFSHVQDLILAVAFKQKGEDYLKKFEEEVSGKGRMNRSLDDMFDKLYGRVAIASRVTFEPGKKSVIDNVKRSNRFAPTSLKAVHPARFQVLYVDRDRTIMDFVQDHGLTFQKGRGFYELTKSVMVQSYKEVILQDRHSGDFYTGEYARDLVGLPHGENAQLRPVSLDKYKVFIQSTSNNRKLLGDTEFLYEVDATLR